jgi:hypothetical protein
LNLKRLIVPGIAAGAIAVALTMPIGADDGEISTTITPLVISVSVSPDTVNYGTAPMSAADNSRSTKESPTITVTNTGSVPIHVDLRGSDAEPDVNGQATWTLNCEPIGLGVVGTNQFVHKFGLGATPDFNGSGINTLCSDSNKRLQSNLALNGQSQFMLQFAMPTASTGLGPRSSSVTVVATQANP